MRILVKSFNRPYYLERCLKSIQMNLPGDHKVFVLDDGTPPRYLDEIAKRFPKVVIVKSDRYDEKVKLVQLHLSGHAQFINSAIPTDFWRSAVSDCEKYFLLLEEDAWITEKVALASIEAVMESLNMLIVKLGWNNNENVVRGEIVKVSDEVDELIPLLPTDYFHLMTCYLKDTFRMRSILERIGLTHRSSIVPYYSLYTVSSAVFDKGYWLYLWSDALKEKFNEGHQLSKALSFRKKDSTGKYGKTFKEFVHTSFITASYNRLKSLEFDMIRLNHILNEGWLAGEIDSMDNFPRDFDVNALLKFVDTKSDSRCSAEAWSSWISFFKSLHRSAGSTIE